MTVTLRRNLILLAVLVAIALLLLLLDSRGRLGAVRGPVGTVVSPIARVLTDLGEQAAGIGDAPRTDTERELADLRAQYDAVLADNARLREIAAEVEQLREQLGFQQARPDLKTLPADVLLRDPQSREKYIIINRGSNDGVQVGMAVVSPYFFVGQVTAVEPAQSRVLLVIDSGFQTGAGLQLSGQEGIVYGRWQEGGRVVLRHIPVDAKVQADAEDGELVVTSGKTQGVPAGLIIGKAIEARPNELQNETEVEVLPLVDFDDLQSVSVIVGTQE